MLVNDRQHKRKVAIMLGYLGTKYQGMQVNKDASTIEGVLFEALCKSGFVSRDNSNDQKKISLMRACRTDKGVHAAMQVVSAKLIFPLVSGVNEDKSQGSKNTDSIMALNNALPSDIRVYGIQRTSNSFQARNQCDSRVYEYLLPTYVLAPLDTKEVERWLSCKVTKESNSTEEPLSKRVKSKETGNSDNDFSDTDTSLDGDSDSDAEQSRSKSDIIGNAARTELDNEFRLTGDALNRFRSILSTFEGSIVFHNYTIGKDPSDPSTRRVIRSFKASDPIVLNGTGKRPMEWIRLRIHGQSFMMHQIRKMIGMSILLMRVFGAFASDFESKVKALLDRTFMPKLKFNIPKIPGFGLLLLESCFDTYNRKFPDKEQLSYTTYKNEIDDFKTRTIYPELCKQEEDGHLFAKWWSGVTLNMSSIAPLVVLE